MDPHNGSLQEFLTHFSPTPLQSHDPNSILHLPEDMLNHIIKTAGNDSDYTAVNKFHLNLRRCSKHLAAATDASRVTITLHPYHLHNVGSYLRKLASLSAITMFAPTFPALLWCDISLISSVVNNLASLTFHPAQSLRLFVVPDINQALTPWRNCLKHLDFSSCRLVDSALVRLLSWSPDLAGLTSFKMTHGTLKSLNLRGCPELLELDLSDNLNLTHVGVSGMRKLSSVMIRNNNALRSLDMLGCSQLLKLSCTWNNNITSVKLGRCSALQNLTCTRNRLLKGLVLSECESLKELNLESNARLETLDTAGCNMLHIVGCVNSPSLTDVKLPQRGSLEHLTFICCRSLPELDLSWISTIKTLRCVGNSMLRLVEARHCDRLTHIKCVKNCHLSSLDFSYCGALRSVLCSYNSKLSTLNVSGCENLDSLCVNNVSLNCPQLPGCGNVVCVKSIGSGRLQRLDLPSFPNLREEVLQ